MRERLHGGKYLGAKIDLKHGLLNDGELGLLRFTMLLTRTAENTPSATKVKAKKGYKINDTHNYLIICQLTETLDTPS